VNVLRVEALVDLDSPEGRPLSQEPVEAMQSPSLASVALVAFVLAAFVGAFLPNKSHSDHSVRPYIPQLLSQAR
jgi:hypothetical protein